MYTLEMVVDGKSTMTQLGAMPTSIVLTLYSTAAPVRTVVATKVVL